MNIAASTRRNLLLVELREGCRVREAQISQHTVALIELHKALKHLCTTEKIMFCLCGYYSERMIGIQVMAHMSYWAREYKEILLLLFSTQTLNSIQH